MKIAVTGCNGSVGSRVVLLGLKLGHTIVGIDVSDRPDEFEAVESTENSPSRFIFHKSNLTVYEDAIATLKGCDAIVHLAGKSVSFDTWKVIQVAHHQ